MGGRTVREMVLEKRWTSSQILGLAVKLELYPITSEEPLQVKLVSNKMKFSPQ